MGRLGTAAPRIACVEKLYVGCGSQVGGTPVPQQYRLGLADSDAASVRRPRASTTPVDDVPHRPIRDFPVSRIPPTHQDTAVPILDEPDFDSTDGGADTSDGRRTISGRVEGDNRHFIFTVLQIV
ncbi:MAG: hypothetical protein OXG46_12465 [Chloroflexi bacterium]|nr:hypothetical protein [Chloroflexota bacterium]